MFSFLVISKSAISDHTQLERSLRIRFYLFLCVTWCSICDTFQSYSDTFRHSYSVIFRHSTLEHFYTAIHWDHDCCCFSSEMVWSLWWYELCRVFFVCVFSFKRITIVLSYHYLSCSLVIYTLALCWVFPYCSVLHVFTFLLSSWTAISLLSLINYLDSASLQ